LTRSLHIASSLRDKWLVLKPDVFAGTQKHIDFKWDLNYICQTTGSSIEKETFKSVYVMPGLVEKINQPNRWALMMGPCSDQLVVHVICVTIWTGKIALEMKERVVLSTV
jgi:hypothetical protein